jgi:hypothetical protein
MHVHKALDLAQRLVELDMRSAAMLKRSRLIFAFPSLSLTLAFPGGPRSPIRKQLRDDDAEQIGTDTEQRHHHCVVFINSPA